MPTLKKWSQRAFAVGLLSAIGASGCSYRGDESFANAVCRPITDGRPDSDGGPPVACIPSLNGGKPIVADCGVFVRADAGDDNDEGSPEKPVKTLKRAIALAQGKTGWVYACAGSFEEAVEVPAGVSLFGGLDCMSMSSDDADSKCPAQRGWLYKDDPTRTTLTAPADQIPLRVQSGTGTTLIHNFDVTAESAQNSGGSSIAALVDGATAQFSHCTFQAGDGKEGGAGESTTGMAEPGLPGNEGTKACSTDPVSGAMAVTSSCSGAVSTSGLGGQGSSLSPSDGTNGSPGSSDNYGTKEASSPCSPGKDGEPGAVGDAGVGALGLGTLSSNGYVGEAGTAGGTGGIGQGGGGGGGAKGGTGTNQCSAGSAGGASGGSGGSGGCGGAGGKGGSAGGSSIALISLKATLVLTGVTLRTGSGGKGGDGGSGQQGGRGGGSGSGGIVASGISLNPGCRGGNGGDGGSGGQGGGGRGGHAIGLAYILGQGEPTLERVSFDKGTPGPGGAEADPAHAGKAGEQTDVQVFP